jgi:prephenate dehydrogenase
MKLFNKITIIGVGLIGGSIGLAIRKKRLAREVTGVFRHAATLKRALKRRAVDTAAMSVREGVKDADLIIVASPVHSIPALVGEAARYAKKGAIITDAGSTKSWISAEVGKSLKKARKVIFVGSHPMAGSEHAGVEYALSDLFKNSACIVTRGANTDTAALKKIVRFWKALGARVSVMSASAHDRSVSMISHLPHIVAFGVAGAVPQSDLKFAAEGFKDTTRVASSDAELWADIFHTNKKEVLRAGKFFEKYYKRIMTAVANGDHAETVRLLERAKAKRDKFVHGKKD